MTSLYTKSIQNTPEGLTKPTISFKKHVWLSILGLLFFVVVYLTLIIWFGRLAYYSFIVGGNFWHFLLGVGYAFLCLFMIKGLFIFKKREKDPLEKYITESEEPVLFDYLYKLADEAGAPRPSKVFLSPRVNASVSYDLSILNLIIPSKKNLEIGLGLINVLSLGELKAVLAHEFGHFAQRSMLLGRYVYIAQQVAVQIIVKRDLLDKFLVGISSIDIRISWIGWILSILVWAVRSLIETIFGIVTIAQRALSREMEFQADLVAVSLTGSDALIHALSRLQVADEAYDHAVAAVNMKLSEEQAIHNLYKLQTNYIEKMSWVLNDESYGKSPKPVLDNPAANRVFGKRAYNPPKMWSTHPADNDREANAKKTYIPAQIDERPAEDLLSDSGKYEIQMTADLIATADIKTEPLTDDESIAFQNKKYFTWTFLDPRYNSNFLNRFFTINFKNSSELFSLEINERDLASNFDLLYDKQIIEKLDNLKEIKEEIASLDIALHEVITIEKREIWHRGDKILRKDVADIIKSLEHEEAAIIKELNAHDILCHSTHYQAANKLDENWARYLKTLGNLVHYSEHTIADLNDAAGKYQNVVAIALADGNVSSSELTDIIKAGYDYYKAIKSAFQQSNNLQLNKELLKNSNKESYADFFEEFKLEPPTKENIDGWSKVIESWANVAMNGLDFLRNSSLEHLLDVEENIRLAFLNKAPLSGNPPTEIKTVETYTLLTPGTERPLQRKLKFWDRFMMGEGLVGTAAKFAVSALLIGGALFIGDFSQSTSLTLYNGLHTEVVVDIKGEGEWTIPPYSNVAISVDHDADYDIVTTQSDGREIERFNGTIESPGLKYIYNIANAGVFIEYTAYYSDVQPSTPTNRNKGAKRWFANSSDYILENPPNEAELGTRKDVLVAYSDVEPYDMLATVSDSNQLRKLIETHVVWDSPDNESILTWVTFLRFLDNPQKVLDKRIKNFGKDMIAQRAKMDMASGDEKNKICEEINQSFKQNSENPDYYYLNTRCLEDSDFQNNSFVNGYKKWSNHPWLAYASAHVYAQNEEWEKSLQAFNTASQINSLKGVLALDAERIRRVVQNTNSNARLEFKTDQLNYYLDIDNGAIKRASGDANYAHVLIANGKFKDAQLYLSNFESYKPYILRLLAVSKGVTLDIIDEVKLLNEEEGINSTTIWYSFAYNHLKGIDNTKNIADIGMMGVSSSDLNTFINSIASGNYSAAETIVSKQQLFFKGYMYAMGYIISKRNAPEKWKNRANDLLFAHEKPYFGK